MFKYCMNFFEIPMTAVSVSDYYRRTNLASKLAFCSETFDITSPFRGILMF